MYTSATTALGEANRAKTYYEGKAKGGMISSQIFEYLIAIVAFSVTIVGVAVPNSSKILAILGGAITFLAAVAAVTHGKDEWIRCGIAAGKLELEMRAYEFAVPPYDNQPSRDAELIEAVNRIKSEEFGTWYSKMRPAALTGGGDGKVA